MQVGLTYLVADDTPKVHVLARVAATGSAPTGSVPSAPDRTPVNLALVIDRSSSMRGPRLTQAIRAAREVATRLNERDRFALIVFDSSARIAFGPANMTAEARQQAIAVLADLPTGLGTNLAAGWKKGVEAVSSGFVRGAIARVAMLTDGQPSVGVTDARRLSELAEIECSRGVTTTTMGIGENFDDELLSEIARRGGGGFYYLATPESIPAAFGSELSGVFSIVATSSELKMVPDQDVISVEVLHHLPSRLVGDGLVVSLGDIAGGPPRQVMFKLHLEPSSTTRRLGTLMLTYREPDGASGQGHIVGIERPQVATSPDVEIVTLERLRLEVASAVDEAWARRGLAVKNEASGALMAVRRAVTQARDEKRAEPSALADLLAEIELAEIALASGEEEREHARRGLRERSQLTLLGHSQVRRLPELDDE
jgi:Ca-activated chloride channel homolog